MPISDELLSRVNDEPLEVTQEVCQSITGNAGAAMATHYVEVAIFLRTVIEAGLIEYDGPIPAVEEGKIQKAVAIQFASLVQNSIEIILNRNKAIAAQLSIESRIRQVIKGSFGYEFTDGDIKRVQILINELRELLAADTSLDENHKRRLLVRLEALQKELHKKISDLKNFWALVGDAGIALGKLGTDAKPFVDRLKEIVQIGWNSQARAEELPSNIGNPLLGHDDEPPALN